MMHGTMKGQSQQHLWYVGNDLIGHTTGVEGVLQRHPSLQALSETLENQSRPLLDTTVLSIPGDVDEISLLY